MGNNMKDRASYQLGQKKSIYQFFFIDHAIGVVSKKSRSNAR